MTLLSRRLTYLPLMLASLPSCFSPSAKEVIEPEFPSLLLDRWTGPKTPTLPEHPSAVSSEPNLVRAYAIQDRDVYRGLFDVSSDAFESLREASGDPILLDKRLESPLSIPGFTALAILRSPLVGAARERLEAARTSYQQSLDLKDLVALYRSFVVGTATRVGPDRSRRPTSSIAPPPNVDGLSAEIAHRRAAIAFEELRKTIRSVIARVWRAHADAARLDEARRILLEEVEFDRLLVDVMRTRLEAGVGNQAGFLAFRARVERATTELEILNRAESVVRAEWNELLSRPEQAPLDLNVKPEIPLRIEVDESEIVELALREREELRAASLGVERSELAVRLAETMALPRLDIGSSRFERERTPEAGLNRGPVFPSPGRLMEPRADFGVREAQVEEMRARSEAAKRARDGLRNRIGFETRNALFEVDASKRRIDVHEREIVPLSSDSLESARGAYEGNRASYLDLLDAVQRLLDARLGLADARRDHVHALAELLDAIGVVP